MAKDTKKLGALSELKQKAKDSLDTAVDSMKNVNVVDRLRQAIKVLLYGTIGAGALSGCSLDDLGKADIEESVLDIIKPSIGNFSKIDLASLRNDNNYLLNLVEDGFKRFFEKNEAVFNYIKSDRGDNDKEGLGMLDSAISKAENMASGMWGLANAHLEKITGKKIPPFPLTPPNNADFMAAASDDKMKEYLDYYHNITSDEEEGESVGEMLSAVAEKGGEKLTKTLQFLWIISTMVAAFALIRGMDEPGKIREVLRMDPLQTPAEEDLKGAGAVGLISALGPEMTGLEIDHTMTLQTLGIALTLLMLAMVRRQKNFGDFWKGLFLAPQVFALGLRYIKEMF